MGRLASLLERMKDKRNELVRRAAGKAADAALDRTKKVAFGAVDSVGDAIEKAIFGDVEGSKETPAVGAKPEAPDPFARLKEKERVERETKAREEEQASAKADLDADVDAELQALKKRLKR